MGEPTRFDERLAAIARELVNEPDVQHTLQRVVETAAAHLGRDVFASVSLVTRRREVQTPASSDPRAAQADQLQYDLAEGPCLDAIWAHETFHIEDLAADERYPRWSFAVTEQTGIRSSLSLQLFTDPEQGSLGALNLYAAEPRAFDADTRGAALAFAAQAAVALRSASTEEHLRSAMSTRNVIGQAQGILIERFKITPDQAFKLLTRLSQDSNVKLHEVARRLVETGEVPPHQPR